MKESFGENGSRPRLARLLGARKGRADSSTSRSRDSAWPGRPILAKLAAIAFALSWSGPAHAQTTGRLLVVSPSGPFSTIQAALVEAQEGDTVQVHPGVYAGPVVIDKPVTLEGIDFPVIDNRGRGTVVTLAAPGAVLRGFHVRGSGSEPDRDHSGIAIFAPRTVAENNRLTDVLFGIFVSKASDVIVRGNEVTSKPEYDVARKGDAIRLWFSPRVIVEKNRVYQARDLVIWYSSDVQILENVIERGRYGIHLMYCDRSQINRNQLVDNSVGIYTMYSNNVSMQENLIRGQRGPSGYALGFKDADNIEVLRNVLVDNRAAIYMDGTPFTPQGYSRFRDNIFAFNDVGVIVLPAVRGNTFGSNTFWENIEQVSVQGGGSLGVNRWEGNYWSDYAGFDANGDGLGDLPYRAEQFFEGLTDREPALRALIYSPAQQAIAFAATAFPIVRPRPKFADPAPLVQPASIPAFAAQPAGNSAYLATAGLMLLALSGFLGWLALGQEKRPAEPKGTNERPAASRRAADSTTTFRTTIPAAPLTSSSPNAPALVVDSVSKRYGQVKALDKVSFIVPAGESIALWGPNGAGKTTLLKAILGLISFEGHIEVNGQDVRRTPKLARRSIGYVPQEAVFYDLTVQATVGFYAHLKSVALTRAAALLSRVGLDEHLAKPVPALSGGLKQRLALAIALLADPPVLLLDEPTANLDSQARRDYLDLLAALHHEGKSIVFASHRLEEIESLADRVLLIQDGRLVENLTAEDLRVRSGRQVQMTLWIPRAERDRALACLSSLGWDACANGRGTVVIRVNSGDKLLPLSALSGQGIPVLDLSIERISPWN